VVTTCLCERAFSCDTIGAVPSGDRSPGRRSRSNGTATELIPRTVLRSYSRRNPRCRSSSLCTVCICPVCVIVVWYIPSCMVVYPCDKIRCASGYALLIACMSVDYCAAGICKRNFALSWCGCSIVPGGIFTYLLEVYGGYFCMCVC